MDRSMHKIVTERSGVLVSAPRFKSAAFSLCLSYMSRVEMTRSLSFGLKSELN